MHQAHDTFTRFLGMARRGCAASSQPDEQAAYRLAEAALDDAPQIDEATLQGLAVFLGVAHCNPRQARKLLDRQ